MKFNSKTAYAFLLIAAVLGFFFFKMKSSKLEIGQNSKYSRSATRFPANAKEEPEIKPPHHIHHFSATGPAGYSPTQIRHAYGFDKISGKGAGQKIALIDAYGNPNIQNDLKIFDEKFKLPAVNLKIYYPQGKIKKGQQAWALETSLDVEWAHAVAPQAEIILVIAATATYADLLSAVDYAVNLGATQVSMSWGSSEFAGETSYDFHFNTTKAAFFASSGDSGSGVQWPAASPSVIGVGGTTLHLNAAGDITEPEVAWTDSGGGISAFETESNFQHQDEVLGRGVPDVSLNSDPSTGYAIYDSVSYDGQSGWIQIGGTSAAAPQWAAISAIVNGLRTSSLGSFDSALYTLASPANLSSYFQDITSGCNGAPSATTCAQTGYDFVTGLGTPQIPSLTKALSSLQ